MKKDKKGGLVLILTIVVILALVLIAAIAVYIYIQSNKEVRVDWNLEPVPFSNRASEIDPITVPYEISLIRSDDLKKVPIGFYCDSEEKCMNVRPEIIECMGSDGLKKSLNDLGISFIVSETSVSSRNDVGFMGLIKRSSPTVLGNYICTLKVDSSIEPGQPWAKSKQINLIVE